MGLAAKKKGYITVLNKILIFINSLIHLPVLCQTPHLLREFSLYNIRQRFSSSKQTSERHHLNFGVYTGAASKCCRLLRAERRNVGIAMMRPFVMQSNMPECLSFATTSESDPFLRCTEQELYGQALCLHDSGFTSAHEVSRA